MIKIKISAIIYVFSYLIITDIVNGEILIISNGKLGLEINYGDAFISEKHANFFVNKNNAKSSDMKSLINFIKKKVNDKTGIKLELEIVIVE